MTYFLKAALLIGLILGSTPAPPATEGIAVIVHPSEPQDALAFVELQRVYAGEVSTFGPLCIQQSLSDRFFRRVLDKSDTAVRKLWVKLLLSGKVSHGLMGFRTDAEVIDYIRTHPGAMGFVSASSVTDDVQVVSIDGARPSDPSYALAR